MKVDVHSILDECLWRLGEKGVKFEVNIRDLDREELEQWALRPDAFTSKLRVPYPYFSLEMGPNPVEFRGLEMELLSINVVRVSALEKYNFYLDEYYALSFETRRVGTRKSETFISLWGEDENQSLRESLLSGELLEEGYEYTTNVEAQALVLECFAFLEFFCTRMSESSKVWGDQAKLLKKAHKVGKGKAARPCLKIFAPRRKQNPGNTGQFPKKSWELKREVLVRGGYAQVYWVNEDSIPSLKEKWKAADREAVFSLDERNDKNQVAMILIKEPYKKGQGAAPSKVRKIR